MIRVATFTVLGLIAAAIGCVLLFTGGQSHGAGFSVGNLHVEYMVNAPGVIRPARIEYVVLSAGRFDEQTIQAAAGTDTSFTRVYRDAGADTTVAFNTKPGQTVWIGKDRKVRVASKPLQMSDVQLLEKHAGSESLQAIASLEELQAAVAKLKAERKD